MAEECTKSPKSLYANAVGWKESCKKLMTLRLKVVSKNVDLGSLPAVISSDLGVEIGE